MSFSHIGGAAPFGSNPFSNFFIFSTQPKTIPVLSEKEVEYLNKLIELDLDSILDQGAGEKACKDLGQEIFDHFKYEANGDSYAGKKALQNIADSLPSKCEDGRLRKEYVARAWDRVGDSEWFWMH